MYRDLQLIRGFLNFVNENMGNGKYVPALFINFTRAFETIGHGTLQCLDSTQVELKPKLGRRDEKMLHQIH